MKCIQVLADIWKLKLSDLIQIFNTFISVFPTPVMEFTPYRISLKFTQFIFAFLL